MGLTGTAVVPIGTAMSTSATATGLTASRVVIRPPPRRPRRDGLGVGDTAMPVDWRQARGLEAGAQVRALLSRLPGVATCARGARRQQAAVGGLPRWATPG